MNTNKYLPLGTVVLLNNAQHRLMIVGFSTIDDESENKTVYDYIGCFYPEGIFSMEKILAFNHSDIKQIYFLGFSDDEEKQFKVKLNNAIENMNKNINNNSN